MADVSNTNPTDTARHWAYFLPEPSRGVGYWGREAIAEHSNPDYWAWIWGYSKDQVNAAKEAAREQHQAAACG